MSALTVFHDGSCPLCRAEIAAYRHMKGADRINWLDVSRCGESDLVPDLDRDTVMRRFHVQRLDGTLISGGRAFAELWFHIPRLQVLGRLFRSGPMAWVLDRIYDLFLWIRPLIRRIIFASRS